MVLCVQGAYKKLIFLTAVSCADFGFSTSLWKQEGSGFRRAFYGPFSTAAFLRQKTTE